VTNPLLKPIENTVHSANVVAVTNMVKTNQMLHAGFISTMAAVIKLKMPIKDRCGGKPANGINASRITPEII
jgi:hypothetical protein